MSATIFQSLSGSFDRGHQGKLSQRAVHQAVLCRLSNFNRASGQLTLVHRVDHAKFSEALLHCILMSLMSPLLRGPH